jgi:sulfur carrier protein
MALLLEMGLVGKRVAVEINHEIVPRAQHGDRVLRDGDRIEIVQAIGGG